MYKRFFYLSFLCFVLIFSCDNAEKGLDQLFPGPGFEKGWSWHGMPKHYSPENLIETIDGRAELCLSYGFRELAALTYFWGSVDDTSFTVNIYDMGTPLNGFGLYSNYQQQKYEYEEIGTEAVISDFELRFYQGKYVVEIKAGDDSKKVGAAIRTVARKISERIEDPAKPPEVLSLLPKEGQVGKSLRYVKKEMLSQAFLPGGLEARYSIGDEDVTGFVVLFNSLEEAKSGFEALREFFKESGDSFVSTYRLGEDAFGVKTSSHDYMLIALEGTFLAGVQDLSSPKEGIELLMNIRRRLSEYVE